MLANTAALTDQFHLVCKEMRPNAVAVAGASSYILALALARIAEDMDDTEMEAVARDTFNFILDYIKQDRATYTDSTTKLH